MRVREILLSCLLLFTGVAGASAAEGRVVKTLAHFLDQEGRHTLSPSLYERDAYQDGLRADPGEQSGIRFNVQWKSSVRGKPLTLKLELIGSDAWQSEPLVLERPVIRRGIFSQWSTITLRGSDFSKIGSVMAWRTSLWDGESMIGEQQSFLWQDAESTPQPDSATSE